MASQYLPIPEFELAASSDLVHKRAAIGSEND